MMNKTLITLYMFEQFLVIYVVMALTTLPAILHIYKHRNKHDKYFVFFTALGCVGTLVAIMVFASMVYTLFSEKWITFLVGW